jgi:RNA 3'-terminal phosphate cyclase (ATP)
VVLVELKSGNVTEMVSGVGKVGVKAEQVARQAYRTAKAYLESNVPVGEYLADQLMMPMGLAASRGQSSEFRTMELSMHSQTHLDVLKRFLDIETSVVQEEAGSVVVRISPGS